MVYFVEGNIGAGKTTLLKKIESFKFPNTNCTQKPISSKFKVIYEPVDDWMKMKATPESKESIFELY